MKKYNICVIKGDGIGPEIIDEAIKVLDAVAPKFGFELNYNFFLMGGRRLMSLKIRFQMSLYKAR